MKLDCTFVERVGSKSGKKYYAIDIKLTPDYTKTVFLEKAEEALITTTYRNNVNAK